MSHTVIKQLPFVWKVGGQEAKEIEVRGSSMNDVLEAETQASPMQPNAFNVQMACLQVVRAGNFTGPFVAAHFKTLKPRQFGLIADAMREADALGED